MLVVLLFTEGGCLMKAKLCNKQQNLFDHYVSQHQAGDLLQTSYWGELKSYTSWTSFPLAVIDQGKIQACALILKRYLPVKPYSIFYSPRGPLFSNIEALNLLIESGKDLAQQHNAIMWKMDPALRTNDPQWTQITNQLVKNNLDVDFGGIQPKFIMELNIKSPLDHILAAMKAKTRYNIRYAERKGVEISLSHNKSDLEIFYPLLTETALRDRFTVRSFSYFEHLWDCLITNRKAQLFLAYYKNQPLAGSIAFRLGKRAWYVYGASSNKRRNLQASYALQWKMIQWAKGSGCDIYDFRGVSGIIEPSHPLYGLYRFKEGFGARLVEYIGEYDLALSPLYWIWRPSVSLYNNLLKPVLSR